jgi:hypothetical protein
LNEGYVFAGSNWDNNRDFGGASVVALAGFSNTNTLDGYLVGGQNSMTTVGTVDENWLKDIITDINSREDAPNWNKAGMNAAFGVFAPISVGDGTVFSGGIVVDPTINQASYAAQKPAFGAGGASELSPGFLAFANNSLLAINLTGLDEGDSVFSANGTAGLVLQLGGEYSSDDDVQTPITATGSSRATLYLANAKAGTTYTLFEGITALNVDDNAAGLNDLVNGSNEVKINDASDSLNEHWTNENLIFSSELLGLEDGDDDMWLEGDGTNMDFKIRVARVKSAGEIYPLLSNGMVSMVNSFYDEGVNNVYYDAATGQDTYTSEQAGIAFVSRLTDNDFVPNHTEAAVVLESAAQIAVAAGVPALTNNVVTKISTLVVDHVNLLNETQPAYGNEPGAFGLWVNPFYGMSDVDGMDAGNFETGYELNYGGAAFGFDYNLTEAFRLGLALNVGGGDSESDGDLSDTQNDFDFFGASLYGSYSNGAFGLTADLGYTAVDNDIEQDLLAVGLGMGNSLESQVDSYAFTIGLTGQYRFTTASDLNITPHLGVRYTKISTDDANIELANGNRVFDVETDDQNLFQNPV